MVDSQANKREQGAPRRIEAEGTNAPTYTPDRRGRRIELSYRTAGAIGGTILVIGYVASLIASVIGRYKPTTPAEAAANEFFLGQRPKVTYSAGKDEKTIRFSGIRGLNANNLDEVLIPGVDEMGGVNNRADGIPDSIGRVVVTDINGNPINQTTATAGINEIQVRIVPVYGQLAPGYNGPIPVPSPAPVLAPRPAGQ